MFNAAVLCVPRVLVGCLANATIVTTLGLSIHRQCLSENIEWGRQTFYLML